MFIQPIFENKLIYKDNKNFADYQEFKKLYYNEKILSKIILYLTIFSIYLHQNSAKETIKIELTMKKVLGRTPCDMSFSLR